jgi:hypothetical protein
VKGQFPEEVPFPLFYEPEGLLPWGSSIDGDIFCWSTRGLSGHWTVRVIGRDTGNEQFPVPMTQFLFEALTGKVRPWCFPRISSRRSTGPHRRTPDRHCRDGAPPALVSGTKPVRQTQQTVKSTVRRLLERFSDCRSAIPRK